MYAMKTSWKPGTMVYPIPAVMVSCGATPDEYNIMTAAWTGTICSEPPMCYVSIRPERHSYGIIKRTGEFVINLTTESLAEPTDWCGVRSGTRFRQVRPLRTDAREVGCRRGTRDTRSTGIHRMSGKGHCSARLARHVHSRGGERTRRRVADRRADGQTRFAESGAALLLPRRILQNRGTRRRFRMVGQRLDQAERDARSEEETIGALRG